MAASNGRRRPATGRISPAHKAALAEGREQGRVVRRYLEALATPQPNVARRRPARIGERLAAIERELEGADPLRKVLLSQERIDLRKHVEAAERASELAELETAFIDVARAYSERKGITYEAWRAGGVPPEVLRRAGIPKSD